MPKNTSNAQFGQVLSEIWPAEVFGLKTHVGGRRPVATRDNPSRSRDDASWSCDDGSWSRADGLCCATTQAGRGTTGPGRAQTGPKNQKTLEGHISLKTCPKRAFEVFFGIYKKCRCQKTPQTPDSDKF